MKKFMSLMVALGLVLGMSSMAFAQDDKKDDTKKEKKLKKKKKKDGDSTEKK